MPNAFQTRLEITPNALQTRLEITLFNRGYQLGDMRGYEGYDG